MGGLYPAWARTKGHLSPFSHQGQPWGTLADPGAWLVALRRDGLKVATGWAEKRGARKGTVPRPIRETPEPEGPDAKKEEAMVVCRWIRRGPMLAGLLVFAAGCASVPPAPEAAAQLQMARARRDLGVDYLAKGRTALAIRELRYAATLDPADASTQLWLGEAHRRKKRLTDARRHAEQAVRLDPDLHSARLNLSGLYLQMSRYAEAASQAQILIDDPTYEMPWQALNNRGWSEFQQGFYDEARASFEEALDYRRGYWPARLNLGILEESQGNVGAAIAQFKHLIEISPEPVVAEANFRMAEVYVHQGQRKRAIHHFSASLANAPDGPWSDRSREFLAFLR